MTLFKKFIFHKYMGKIKSLFLTFSFNKESYHYFYHLYNSAWLNERAVEIPIIWEKVKQYKEEDVLEVGNVLSHYFSTKHKVVDKYEKGSGVDNIDVVNFKSKKKYSLIVSISTLEHVGWDEDVKDPKKINLAIRTLKKNLKPGGELWITLPLGYNPNLDKILINNELILDKTYFLKRTSLLGIWNEIYMKSDRKDIKYNFPFPNANVICVGMFKNINK